jgi:hypothetical protein
LTLILSLVSASPARRSRDVRVYLCTAIDGWAILALQAPASRIGISARVQEADASRQVTFDDLSGCYSGRWPHIHFEVYRVWRRRPTRTTKRPRGRSRAMAKSANDLVTRRRYESSAQESSRRSRSRRMASSVTARRSTRDGDWNGGERSGQRR